MKMNRADALDKVRQLLTEMPASTSESSIRIGWWMRFSQFLEELKAIDAPLEQKTQEQIQKLRAELLSHSLLRLKGFGNAFQQGSQMIERYSGELKGILSFLSVSLKNVIEDEQKETIQFVHDVAVNLDKCTVTYANQEKKYQPGKLPWKLFQLCAREVAVRPGEATIHDFMKPNESDAAIRIRLNSEINRINAFWKKKTGARLLSVSGKGVYLKPILDAE